MTTTLTFHSKDQKMNFAAKIFETPCSDNGYKYRIVTVSGVTHFLTGHEVLGNPAVGDVGTITYLSTASRGWWSFRCD